MAVFYKNLFTDKIYKQGKSKHEFVTEKKSWKIYKQVKIIYNYEVRQNWSSFTYFIAKWKKNRPSQH